MKLQIQPGSVGVGVKYGDGYSHYLMSGPSYPAYNMRELEDAHKAVGRDVAEVQAALRLAYGVLRYRQHLQADQKTAPYHPEIASERQIKIDLLTRLLTEAGLDGGAE